MLRRCLRIAAYILSGVAAAAFLLTAALALRLSQGPVSLGFLTPLLERTLSDQHPDVDVRVGGTVLRWEGARRGVDLRLTDVDVVAVDSDRRIARLPELQITFSPDSLRRRALLVEAVELFRLSLTLEQTADGDIRAIVGGGDGDGPAGNPSEVLDSLFANDDSGRPTSALQRIDLVDAQATLVDTAGRPLVAVRLREGSLHRAGDDLRFRASLALFANDRPQGEIAATAIYDRPSRRIEGESRLQAVNPAAFAAAVPALEPLGAIELPLSGSLAATLAGDGTIERLGVELGGADGALVVTESLAARLGVTDLAQRLPVVGARLAGSYDGAAAAGDIQDLSLRFAAGTVVRIPAPVDHAYPIVSLTARGRGSAEAVRLEALTLDLGGPVASAAAEAERVEGRWRGRLTAGLDRLQVDDFARYWPATLASGAREWCLEHLSGGDARGTALTTTFAETDDGIRIESLSGSILAEGVGVDYLPPLPAVRNASGRATFDLDRFAIDIAGGTALDLSVRSGRIVFAGFDQPVETLDLDLTIDGPLRDALEVLSREPLGYTRTLGIDPARSGGSTRTRLRLKFPLLDDLPMEKVSLSVTAQVTEVALEGIVADLPISDGTLDLQVDGNGLGLGGRLRAGGIPGQLTLRYEFAERAPEPLRLEFVTTPFAVETLHRLAGDRLSLAPYLVGGELGGRIQVRQSRAGAYDLTVRADLAGAEVALAPLGWQKPPGRAASLELEAILEQERLTRIPRFAATAEDLDLRGAVRFGPDGTLRGADIQRLVHGRTDIRATASRSPATGWQISVAGTSFDVQPLRHAAGGTRPDATPADRPPDLRLEAAIDQVWFGDARRLDAVTAAVVREGTTWKSARLDARVADGSPISLDLRPDETGVRRLRARAENAGATLEALGILSDMRGGTLRLEAAFDEALPGQPLSGRLRVNNFTLVNAPLLARLLNVLALTGILDLLRGSGISFGTLDAPFVWTDPLIEFSDVKAHGTSLGITATGRLDTAAETLDVRGTLVPFYLVNAALGRLPLIGDLFTGGEEGGGVFAANYTIRGALAEPSISVNPLSILGPGVLRHVFSLFDMVMPEFTPSAPSAETPPDESPPP